MLLGRRNSDTRKSNRNPQQSASPIKNNGNVCINFVDSKKQLNTKKKGQNKSKNGNDSTPGNLARTILHNLNIFGKLLKSFS